MMLRWMAVPTRHGVQNPQLSWAKKCAKFRATSKMSRSGPNTMNAPAVETSSKAIRRLNSSGVTRTPDAPPIWTAVTVGGAPQSCRTRPMVTPNWYS